MLLHQKLILIQERVRKKDYRVTLHAEKERDADKITKREIEEAILSKKTEIIEDYPEDKRGHSCLIAGFPGRRRPIHVVCAPKEGYLAVITTYVPDLTNWKNNFKTRKK